MKVITVQVFFLAKKFTCTCYYIYDTVPGQQSLAISPITVAYLTVFGMQETIVMKTTKMRRKKTKPGNTCLYMQGEEMCKELRIVHKYLV